MRERRTIIPYDIYIRIGQIKEILVKKKMVFFSPEGDNRMRIVMVAEFRPPTCPEPFYSPFTRHAKAKATISMRTASKKGAPGRPQMLCAPMK